MRQQEAIAVALEAYRQPHVFQLSRRNPLPQGMSTLLKIVSGAPEEVDAVVATETAKHLPIREAAIFYLQQVLIKAEDDYRQLALSPDASLQDVKDHKRMLLKWLHPDRNRNKWESNLFQRVKSSAERLESSLRSGVKVEVGLFQERRKVHRKEGAWKAAQRRVRKPIGWRTRLLKVTVGLSIVIILVALAQLGLTAVHTGEAHLAQTSLYVSLAGSTQTPEQQARR